MSHSQGLDRIVVEGEGGECHGMMTPSIIISRDERKVDKLTNMFNLYLLNARRRRDANQNGQ